MNDEVLWAWTVATTRRLVARCFDPSSLRDSQRLVKDGSVGGAPLSRHNHATVRTFAPKNTKTGPSEYLKLGLADILVSA